MAGIGFTLKKLFNNESYTNRSKAYLYSALVAAGPWIAAVITVNIVIFLMDFYSGSFEEKELFMGTIVYSFIFSQIITSPWQMVITRYIADKLYNKDYDYIRPSFIGLNKIVFFSALSIAIIFYISKPIPITYKIMSIYLFVILAMIWILMVYLSAVKDYELIAKAYIYGGLISIALTIYFIYKPLPFSSLIYSSNILFSYLIGLSVTYILLVYNFLSTFYFGNYLVYDFLRYLDRFRSLFWIGLLYTVGLWIDDILMWLSSAGVEIFATYQYAPIYDNAVFLAYLTTIPSSVLFLVSIETEFYDTYKKYFGLSNKTGTFSEISIASKEMKKTIYQKLFYTFQVQALITLTIVLFSKPIFNFLNIGILIRNIFRVCAFGALFNVFILLIILILLYFESRKRALLISAVFLTTNLLFTIYFANKGLNYYGYGFTLGSFITFMFSCIIIVRFLKKINFRTFALQPLFSKEEKGIFILLADKLNDWKEGSKKGKKLGLGRKHKLRLPKLYINIGIIVIIISICLLVHINPSIFEYTKKTDVSKQNSSNEVFKKDMEKNLSQTKYDVSTEQDSQQNKEKDNLADEENTDKDKSYYMYVLNKGDTLFRIAELFYGDKEVAYDIQKINAINDVTNILVDDVLLLPSNIRNNDEIMIPKVKKYKIMKGDTLYSISLKFYGHKGMIEDIIITNSIEDEDNIMVGSEIILPVESKIHRVYNKVRLYTVQSGDTLFSISMKIYGKKDKIDEIIRINDIEDIHNVSVGRVLKLP